MSDQQEVGPTNAPAYAARTIGQIRLHGAWRHELAHHCSKSRLFWLTRGTTRITAELHPIMATGPKILFIPASMLLSIELPTQLQGHVAYFPNLADLELPQTSLCLTPSSAGAQVELTGLIERMARLEDEDTPSARRMKRGFGLLLSANLSVKHLFPTNVTAMPPTDCAPKSKSPANRRSSSRVLRRSWRKGSTRNWACPTMPHALM